MHTYFAVQVNPVQPIIAEWTKKLLWFLLPKSKSKSSKDEENIDFESVKQTVTEAIQAIFKDTDGEFMKTLDQTLKGHLPKMQQGSSPLQGQLESIEKRLKGLEEGQGPSKSSHQQEIDTVREARDGVAGELGSIDRQFQINTALMSIANELELVEKRLKKSIESIAPEPT